MRGLAVAALLLTPTELLAHPGGLNAEGCHNNRKTGEYHCHRSPRRSPSAPPQRLKESGGSSDVYYRNCTMARAAGAAPIRYGEPGYARHLDRDGDGIACE